MIKKIFNKKYVLPVALLLLLILCLKVADYGVGGFVNIFKSDQKITEVDSTWKLEYDSLSRSIDKNIEILITKSNPSASKEEIKKLVSEVKISKPLSKPHYSPSNSSEVYYEKKSSTFYLVTQPGFITNGRGAVQYYLPGGGSKYYYEINLKEGVYSFITVNVTPQDTVSFAIDRTGAYKLGYQENHPNFLIFKDSLP